MNTQISIWEVFTILFIHWFADFVLQTDEQAKGKASSWHHLLSHTLWYSIAFVMPVIIYCIVTTSESMLLFIPITFAAHTATDYYTSRVNAQLYKGGKIHDFFVSVGFDQLLHFAQLLITFQLLK